MNKKSIQPNTKSTQMRTHDTIIIPELEEAMERYQPHKTTWSAGDLAVLKRYYGRVPITALESTLHRNSKTIHGQAAKMGGIRNVPFDEGKS